MFRSVGRVLQKPLPSLTRGYLNSSLARNVDVSPEVLDALSRAAPVVALESTVISHGIPYPANLDLALSLENIVRSTGAIPATIGLLYHRLLTLSSNWNRYRGWKGQNWTDIGRTRETG